MASTQKDILDAVQEVIKDLSLTDCEEVAVRAEPRDGSYWYPGITISPAPEVEYRGTNERDDIGYGIRVTMVVNNDVDPSEEDLYGTWRQAIRQAFIHQKLDGVDGICTVLVEPGPIYQNVPQHLDVGSLLLRVISRETRG